MQLAGWNRAECVPINQPTHLTYLGAGAQQASLETWQPGDS